MQDSTSIDFCTKVGGQCSIVSRRRMYGIGAIVTKNVRATGGKWPTHQGTLFPLFGFVIREDETIAS